ncbi:MAG: hypothetical protein K2L07_03735 [Lachnospiraceae bacterium]|nr:hypothetical protein [Lachnospiraceae bacterium]
MQSYKRKITYFYEHHKDNVGTTAGFLKLEIRGDKVKIIINIQEPVGLPYHEAELYFYHEAGDHLAAVKTGEVERANGMLIYQDRTDWQNMYGTGRDLYTFDGVAVVYSDSHYYIGDFKDKDRKDYPLKLRKNEQENQKNKKSDRAESLVTDSSDTEDSSKMAANPVYRPGMRKPKNENMDSKISEIFKQQKEEKRSEAFDIADVKSGNKTDENPVRMPQEEQDTLENWYENIPSPEENVGVDTLAEEENRQASEYAENRKEKNVYDKCESCPYYKKRKEQQESRTTFEKMLAEYPKLPMYGASELFDCVRIHPRDIGKLDMRNWKLGVNSFLTHGFYTYQYLLLGKMRFDSGREQPIIGVPGVFSNRDKYLANMFGFDQFIPVKKTGTKTGEFGYWIVELQ